MKELPKTKRKRVLKRRNSAFVTGTGTGRNLWPDSKTLKLIKVMKLFPDLQKYWGRHDTKTKIEKCRLERLMGCPISTIGRKWKTLKGYYNRLLHRSTAQQRHWQYFDKMASTLAMDDNESTDESTAASNADESSNEDAESDLSLVEPKDEAPEVISDEEANNFQFPVGCYTHGNEELLNFKLMDIAMRFGIEQRNMVESQMLNLCISLEKQLLQRQMPRN